MEDRKLPSLQEIVADIHRSAEEIDENCCRSGLLEDSGSFSEQSAGRNITTGPYPISSTVNTGHEIKDAPTSVPAVAFVNFDIKGKPQHEDDIDGILEDLENYEGIASPLKPTLDKSPAEVLKSEQASSPVSTITSVKSETIPSMHGGFPTVLAARSPSLMGDPDAAAVKSICRDDSFPDSKITKRHPTIAKIESLINKSTIDSSNVDELQNANISTVSNPHIQDESSGKHVTPEVTHKILSSTSSLQRKSSQSIDGSGQSSQSNGSPIRDSIQNRSSPKGAEESANPVSSQHKSEDNVNRSESIQSQPHEEVPKSDQIISKNDHPADLKLEAKMIEVKTHDVGVAKCEILQEKTTTNAGIESNFPSDTKDHITDNNEVTKPELSASPNRSEKVVSVVMSRDMIANETDNASTIAKDLESSRNKPHSPKNQNSPSEDFEFGNTSSATYNMEGSFAHDSPMTSRDMSQNFTENDSFLGETDPISPGEKNENIDQDDLCEDENYDLETPLEFTHAFKKYVADYVKKSRSINKASKHFGLPFATIDIWIRKLYRGACEDWLEALLDEKPGEAIYTERFKNAVINYVKKRRCSLEYAAETLNVDANVIRDWRDNANKEKKQAMLSSIQNPLLLERLGLDLHDIRRRRAEEGDKSKAEDIGLPDQAEDFSDEFISAVVRYVKRRKCSIERASKTLNIPCGILRGWIHSMKAKLKSQQLSPNDKRQLLRIWPQSNMLSSEPVEKDSTPAQNSEHQSAPKRRFVLWKSQNLTKHQTSGDEVKPIHQRNNKANMQELSIGPNLKNALLNQGFNTFKRSVVDHAQHTNSSELTAKHFGIPPHTVFEWAKEDGIEVTSAPTGQNICSPEFIDAVRAFVRKRKRSLISAAGMFHINPKLIMPWKKKPLPPKKSEVPEISPVVEPSDAAPITVEVFKKAAESTSSTRDIEKWNSQDIKADPDEFRMCCNELFPEGQSQTRYSRMYRIDVMRHLVLNNVGVTETAALFSMPRRTVYDWLLRYSEAKIKMQKRQSKSSKLQKKTPSPTLADSEMEDISHSYMNNPITEISGSSDEEMGTNQAIVVADRESSSDDPDYEPSKGDLNDNDRRRIKKEKTKRRSHEAGSSGPNSQAHSLSPAELSVYHKLQSPEGRFSLEKFFANKATSPINESPKNVQLRRIVEEAAQQTLVDPSNKSESSIQPIEDKLEKWIKKQISLSRTVTLSTVKFYALQFAAEMKIFHFTPTSSWCVKFLQRTGLGPDITHDINSKTLENTIDDVIGATSEADNTRDSHYDSTKPNLNEHNIPISEVADRMHQHRLKMEKRKIVPLPPDMLKTLPGPSSQRSDHRSQKSSHDSFEQSVESSNRNLNDQMPYVLLKKPEQNFKRNKDKQTYAVSQRLLTNTANETLISMREQRFRARVVAYARKNGVPAAAKTYKVYEKYVRKWLGHQPSYGGIIDSSSLTSAALSSGALRGESSDGILPIEGKGPLSLPKSSLLKFQDSVKAQKAVKRKSLDPMDAIAKAFSLEPAKSLKLSDNLPTGPEAKKQFFYLDQDLVFLDHAGKGSCLQNSLKLSHACQEHIESQPQFFYKNQFSSYIDLLQKKFAEFIGSEPSDFIFTDTVTSGMETVLRDLQLCRRSSIYYLNLSSVETKDAIQNICEETGCQAQEEILLLPLQSREDIMSIISETLNEGTTIAVFDHCPVDYGFMLPMKEVTLLCHMKGVPVLINGSQGVGQDSLNLSYLGADFYVGSCDRWLCSAKSCSFVYMKKEKQDELYNTNENAESPFQTAYSPKDSRELCSCMAVIPTLSFWHSLGVDDIRIYCQCLLKNGIEIFQSRWDVELLAPFDMHGMTCCVSLPSSLFDDGLNDISPKAQLIEDQLYNEYKIDAPIVCIQNKLYVRISVHLYNHLSDFDKLANAIVEMEADST